MSLLKFLAASGNMKYHLPFFTVLKGSEEAWFLGKNKENTRSLF